MFTVKHFTPNPEGTSLLTIDYADRVEEGFTGNGPKFVRLTRFVTGNSASQNNETVITMDAKGKYGPSAVFVENMQGKTVQRITTDVEWEDRK